MVLVPTRELANQVTKAINTLSAFCAKDVQAVNLTLQIAESAQRALLSSNPEIVVSTPSRVAQHLSASSLNVSQVRHLVIDEADLILSYDHDEDFQSILPHLPKGVHTFLASATLTTEVDTLKGLFTRDPVVLDLQDEEKDNGKVSQYIIKCGEDEKFLLLFALFKLKLIKGKAIIFVADVDRCYRLKLYLEQFGIKSCVLNSELPVNCRIHVVEEFNKNVYDIIIASDEHEVIGSDELAKPADPPAEGEDDKPKKKRQKQSKRSRDYGISRGIDFHNVTLVLNFDLPSTSRSYTHRIGRTARAGRTGIALSFVVPAAEYRKHKLLTHTATANDDKILRRIAKNQPEGALEPYNFDMEKLKGLRYRVESALKAVSSGAIREARIREVRQEVLRSEKLKRHLEENPEDAKWVRHDVEARTARVQPQLKQVPNYLVGGQAGVDGMATPKTGAGWLGGKKESSNRIRRARERNKLKGKAKKKLDPLKTLNAKGRVGR